MKHTVECTISCGRRCLFRRFNCAGHCSGDSLSRPLFGTVACIDRQYVANANSAYLTVTQAGHELSLQASSRSHSLGDSVDRSLKLLDLGRTL